MRGKAIRNLEGLKFGRLTVIEKMPKGSKWLCKCDCGNTLILYGYMVANGNTKSCGCLKMDRLMERISTHGESKTKLYGVWLGMKNRCYQPSYHAHENYANRGIVVCDEWINNYVEFRDWALSNGYSNKLTIDRIDTNGNYEPSNCRWVDHTVQNNNQWDTRFYTYEGVADTLPYLCKKFGVDYKVVNSRLHHGFNLHDAINMPKGKRRKTYYRKSQSNINGLEG